MKNVSGLDASDSLSSPENEFLFSLSELKSLQQPFTTQSLEVSSDSIVALADIDSSKHDIHTFLPPAGQDIPWILKYVTANKEEALLCILFSIAAGLCFILLAILFCLCCRWRRAKNKGSFTVAKSNGEGGTRVSSYVPGGTKETEGLLNAGTAGSSSGGRTYSSPRLVRAEYARGANISSGGATSSTASNANVVGLYLSQAPKSRWSRASDATVWPLPPSSLANSTVDGDPLLVSAITRTLPMHEKPAYMSSPGSMGRTTAVTSTLSPPLVTILSQNNRGERQNMPHVQIQSSFAPASPTDYLFNRQSVMVDPRTNTPSLVASHGPPLSSNMTNEALLRKPPIDDSVMQRKALSYQGGMTGSPYQHHPQHHSYLGPSHPTSPPILPAPASSPWPGRNSQIMFDQHEMIAVGTKGHN